ncbi:hypothetical protein NHQ30_006532 [Ciborinia camelliae]|nr:hypothetical protein NHQ30_006532 [Ciborinia camelliae]
MSGGITKKNRTRARDPATGRFLPKTQHPQPPRAVRFLDQESRSVSPTQAPPGRNNALLNIIDRVKEQRLKMKYEQSQLMQTLRKQKREDAALEEENLQLMQRVREQELENERHQEEKLQLLQKSRHLEWANAGLFHWGQDAYQQLGCLAHRLQWLGGVENQRLELEQRMEHLKAIEEQRLALGNRVEHSQDIDIERRIERSREIQWSDIFKEKFKAAWSARRSNCYSKVKVLIVHWASDDLGVSEEIENLADVFQDLYHFEVAKFEIPDLQPASKLSNRVRIFIGDNSPDTLLIFGYNGHGGFHDTRHDHIWHANNKSNGPSMPSSSVQALFEESASDTILLYDACFSADTAMTLSRSTGSVTELISACGFSTTAPGVGNHSFTSALTHELALAATQKSLPVFELYNRVLARLRNTRDRSKNSTPIRCTLIPDGDRTSIVLKPLSLPLTTSPCRYSGCLDNETVVGHIGLVYKKSEKNDTTELSKWLLKAPADVLNIQLNHVDA